MKNLCKTILIIIALGVTACLPEDDSNPGQNYNTISTDITEQTIWEDINDDPLEIDYLVTANIRVRDLLTIEPGVVIAFESGVQLTIKNDGAIKAIGTASAPIVFKGREPLKGFWGGIELESDDVRNEFNYCRISDGGNTANLYVEGRVSLSNSHITNSSAVGVFLKNSENNNLLNFDNNSFDQNELGAMTLPASSVFQLDAATDWGTGNSEVTVTGVVYGASSEQVWKALKNDQPLTVEGVVSLKSGLRLEPGVILEFEPNSFIDIGWVNYPGYLIAIGTADRPIIFRGKEALAGFWPGIFVGSDDVRNEMQHCVVSDGGGAEIGCCGLPEANIILDGHGDQARLSISNTTITNSLGCGISAKELSGIATLIIDDASMTYSFNQDGDVCE